LPRLAARSASSLCCPSVVQTRISDDEAAIVKTNSPVTANPVIGLDSPDGLFAVGQEVMEDPSEENFSMRPVLKYATKTELSGSAETHDGRSSADAAF